MLKLAKLEFRKHRLGVYIRAAMIANVVILSFLCMLVLNQEIGEEMPVTGYDMAFSIIDTFVRGTYIVFAAVLLAKLVIDEFRKGTIAVLFMYPIRRQKLLAAKLLVVVLFTIAASIATNLFLGVGFYVLNLFTSVVTEPLTWTVAAQWLLKLAMSALATGFAGLIPLYFGMRKYSVSTTIVSSLLVVLLVCQNVNGFTLYSIMAVPIGLSLLGIAVAYMAIRRIEHVDVTSG